MYSFKQQKATYSFVSEGTNPLGERSVYSKKEHLKVLPNLVEGLNFFLQGSTDEMINGNLLKDFDLILSKLGKSLYPIKLNVLPTGLIKKLGNYSDILMRWNNECKHILTLYENAHFVKRYIDITSQNLASEDSFMETLSLTSFIQLLFIDEGVEKRSFILYNFPFDGDKTDFEFNLVASNKNNHSYHYQTSDINNKTGSGEILYTKKGLPERIEFICMIKLPNEDFHSKRISLKLIK